MKQILVTGGAGFIGSNFVRGLLEREQDCTVVNLDDLTYAGNPENLEGLEKDPRYHFVKGNVCDRLLAEELFDRYRIDTVVHFAAESHVDRSITHPEVFLQTNVLGTQALLDAARRNWCVRPDDQHCREYVPGVRFLQVSTDEVYGSLGETGMFTEGTPLAPNSPYSASKASADMIVRSYHATFGLPINITRCSNNYGPCQFPEKLIPLMILRSLDDQPLPVYGDGGQVRDWLYVKDHCAAIEAVLQRGRPGEVYNIGGNNEKTNMQIIEQILAATGKSRELITHVQDRPGHDRRYAIDSAKIMRELGWQPACTFEEGLEKTIRWYMEHRTWLDHIASGEYQRTR